jgi:hypothetical protein
MPGPKYVKEFDYPASAGFHGSAGVQHVKGYARGGPVSKGPVAPKAAAVAKPKALAPTKPLGALGQATATPNYAARAKRPGGGAKAFGGKGFKSTPLVGEG